MSRHMIKGLGENDEIRYKAYWWLNYKRDSLSTLRGMSYFSLITGGVWFITVLVPVAIRKRTQDPQIP